MRLSALVLALLTTLWSASSQAHPIPDIPVRAFFEEGGGAKIHVEVDPRCFHVDPDHAPSVLHSGLKEMPPAERAALIEEARAYIPKAVEFIFEPLGAVTPDFKWDLTGKGGTPLAGDDDVVVLTGTWATTVPAGLLGYRIRALPAGTLSVLFLNHLRGQAVERIAILFPGETGFLLDLTGLSAALPTGAAQGAVGVKAGYAGWWSTFRDFFVQGFVHVLPLGLDHIFFVLGLFLLQRHWKPLLHQVTAFTVAHTITLGLATFGAVTVPGKVVEPVIAASIVFVALENIFRPRYSIWRIAVVFAFGLIHGLGFAGALKELELPTSALLVGLLGFNGGVEAGQLAVIALAFAATFWLRDPLLYRRFVVIPGSIAIALAGAWWTVTRVTG